VLRRYARVVGTGHPENVVTLHPLPATEDILKSIIQRVTHVKGTGDVRGGDDNAVRFFLRGCRSSEIAFAFPLGVPPLFHIMGLITLGKLYRHTSSFLIFLFLRLLQNVCHPRMFLSGIRFSQTFRIWIPA